jgi:hypothetical protein
MVYLFSYDAQLEAPASHAWFSWLQNFLLFYLLTKLPCITSLR